MVRAASNSGEPNGDGATADATDNEAAAALGRVDDAAEAAAGGRTEAAADVEAAAAAGDEAVAAAGVEAEVVTFFAEF